MKPTVPSSAKKQTGRSHPFHGSRELKGFNSDVFEKIFPTTERELSSPWTASQSETLARNYIFNAIASDRQNVHALENATHQQLKEAFLEEKTFKISKQERHIIQIQILDNAIKQLCDLINKNCKDQANFVWKLWSSGADLYQDVIKQLMDEIESSKRQLVQKSLYTEELERKVAALRKQQGILAGEKQNNGVDELAIIRQLEEDLIIKDREILSIQETMTNLSLWFPHFAKFGGSVLGRFLPPFDETDDELLGFLEKKDNNVQDDLKALKDNFYLAQDYLLYDLRRLEKLGIGLSVAHSDPSKPVNNPNNNMSTVSSKVNNIPRREAPVSNKLSVALNQPEELQALSYGLFGGPQSSLSFSAPQENEYNLRHVEHSAGSVLAAKSPSIIPSPNNAASGGMDVDLAVSRAVAVVQQGRHEVGTQGASHGNDSSKLKKSPEGDFDIRLFHTLQYRRASNLSMRGFADDEQIDKHEVFNANRFVLREDFDMLSYTHHQSMVTIQELEQKIQMDNFSATERIEQLERELLQSQNREKQLRDQLNDCQKEADSILVCLPQSCSLPPLCVRDEKGYEIKMQLPPSSISRYTLNEVMEKIVRSLSCFVFSGNSQLCVSWNRGFRIVDNALNGHTMHWLQAEPLQVQVAGDSISFRSVSMSLLAASYGTGHWRTSAQLTEEVNGLAGSVASLIMEEVMRSYRENQVAEHLFSSSQTPWEIAPQLEELHSRTVDRQSYTCSATTECLLFLSRLFGFRVLVDAESEHDLNFLPQARQKSSILEVGLGESSIVTHDPSIYFPSINPSIPRRNQHDEDIPFSLIAPPTLSLLELPLRDQRLFFDISVRCFQAAKGCGITGLSIPISEISRTIRKVFTIVDVIDVPTSFDVARSLLGEHGVYIHPWWRFLSPRIADDLEQHCLQMALENGNLQANEMHESENSDPVEYCSLDGESQSLRLPQLCMNFYHAILQFEHVLQRVLQELYSFIASLAPEGPSSPLFVVLLELLLQPPAGGPGDHDDSNRERVSCALPMALLEELSLLDSSKSLSSATFAKAVLRCAPTNMVNHLCSLICFNENGPIITSAREAPTGLTEIAQMGLNLSVFKNVLGIAENDDRENKYAQVWKKIEAKGVLLLRYVEYILMPTPASSRGTRLSFILGNPGPVALKKKEIPCVASSAFLRSVHHRRVLYGNGLEIRNRRNESDQTLENFNSDSNPLEEDIDRGLTQSGFATKLLYHLRLSFDPTLLLVSDATIVHKLLTIRVAEVLLHRSDIDLLLERISSTSLEKLSMEEFEQKAKALNLQARTEDLQLDEFVSKERSKEFHAAQRLEITFKAWRALIQSNRRR